MQTNLDSTTAVSVGMGIAIAFWTNCAFAQITPDKTLPNNSIVPLNCTNCEITGGTKVDKNLFHSFTQFSVPTGGTAYFNNAVDIQNIISRVTGKSVSNIDGLIRANPTANLFLINPNGIIFGQNAQLNIGGSFVASTASSLKFTDGTEFSAKTPQTTPLLTISTPIGLQYGGNPGNINVQGIGGFLGYVQNRGLIVPKDKTLALVGGNVTLENAFLQAPGGRVELGSVMSDGLVNLNSSNQGWALNYQSVQNLGEIQISKSFVDIATEDNSNINVLGDKGAISLRASLLDIRGTSIVRANTFTSALGGDVNIDVDRLRVREGATVSTTTLGEGSAGNLTVNAKESVEITGTSPSGLFPSSLFTGVNQEATGNGGNLTINTKHLIVKDGGGMSTSTNGAGDAGNLIIRAADTVELTKGAILSTASDPKATGDAGNLTIETGKLNVQTQAGIPTQIITSTSSEGNAGDLFIKASDTVTVSGRGSIISTAVGRETKGKGGNLTIETPSLTIQNLAQIGTGTLGSGNGGNLLVKASESLQLSDSLLTTQSENLGNAGNLTIETGQLIVSDGAQVATGTKDGQAGTLAVTASKSVEVRGVSPTDARTPSGLFASTNGAGDAGSLQINTTRLVIRDGARVLVSTIGSGRGGTLAVNARESTEVSGASINSQSALFAETRGTGNAGSIKIDTGKLTLQDGGLVSAATRSQGQGGSIIVNASDISISGSSASGFTSGILTSTSGSGKGGDVTMTTNNLFVRDGAEVNVSSLGSGNAGSLTVNADLIKLDNQGKLQAATAFGEGGNINLEVRDLILMRRNSLISARADNNGNGGNITINAPFIVAVPREDNDIIANAFDGRGGNINITTNGIYGLQYRPSLTEFSDINASSQFGVNGTVQINTPDADPSRGLVQLPTNLVDASNQIDQACTPGSRQLASSFVITGRGGLPLSPTETLQDSATFTEWVQATAKPENPAQAQVQEQSTEVSTTPEVSPIVEAQGWVVDANGDIQLVAQAPNISPYSPWQTNISCTASK